MMIKKRRYYGITIVNYLAYHSMQYYTKSGQFSLDIRSAWKAMKLDVAQREIKRVAEKLQREISSSTIVRNSSDNYTIYDNAVVVFTLSIKEFDDE